ncbi:MAG: methyltransferase domain-containing protein [Alphaproteobacteria bacterium]
MSPKSRASHNPFRIIRDLESRVDELGQRVAVLDSRFGAAVTHAQVDSLLTAQSKNITDVMNALNMNLIAYAEDRFVPAEWRDEVQRLIASSRDEMHSRLASWRDEIQNQITLSRDEMQSRVILSQDSANTLVEASAQSLREMLNAMNAELLAYTERRLTEFAEEYYELLMRSRRAAVAQNGWASGPARNVAAGARPPKRKDHAPALETVFASLACRAPAAWPVFKQALDVGTRSYEGFPVGSCSIAGHREAERFGAFIAPYLRGYVLDVGCGPQPVPSYLRDYPAGLICGIDPISTADEHPFEFVPAVAEEIPWQDASFDVVCSGTTLDHFFLLDVALSEIRRVLKPGGHFVAWISEAPGSQPYNPYREDITPADEEHLFHIDRAWFLPMMRELGFEEVEILVFSVPFKHLFMSFRKPVA